MTAPADRRCRWRGNPHRYRLTLKSVILRDGAISK
jgi:hypothetical protein